MRNLRRTDLNGDIKKTKMLSLPPQLIEKKNHIRILSRITYIYIYIIRHTRLTIVPICVFYSQGFRNISDHREFKYIFDLFFLNIVI